MIYYVYYIILGLQLMTLLVQKLDEISLSVCSKTKKKLHEKKPKKCFDYFYSTISRENHYKIQTHY